MKLKGLFASAALMIGTLASAGASQATILLSLSNAKSQTDTAYALSFTANSQTATISIGGYQLPNWGYSTDNGLFLNGGGANLLGPRWTLTPAALGSDTFTINDGTSVPGLVFGGMASGYYDTYSQTVATTPGASYTLDFLYTNLSPSAPSGFLVTEIDGGVLSPVGVPGVGSGLPDGGGSNGLASAVPEPSTWALMLAGFASIALGAYRRRPRVLAQI